jgi:uncharacterized membrane protein
MKILLKRPFMDIFLSYLWALIFLLIALIELEHIVRIILGIPILLFIPGHLLTLVLFPMKKSNTSLDTVERIAYSFALSLAIVPITGLILNFTIFGLEILPIILSLLLFILIIGVIALLQGYRFPQEEKIITELDLSFPKVEKNLDSALTLILIASLILAPLYLTYTLLDPTTEEPFTEFYLLGPEFELGGYQTELVIQEETNVIIGIANHENTKINYSIEIWLLDQKIILNKLTNKYETQNNHLWYLDKIQTTLPHNPADINKPWKPQWEYNYTYNINQKGEFKLYFLLFTEPTDQYTQDTDYLNITNQKINDAYRITNLSLSVSDKPKIYNIDTTPSRTLQNKHLNISCSVFDADGINEVYLNIRNPDKRENISLTNNKTGSTYYSNRTYPVAGLYYFYIWTNDTANNASRSSQQTFTITDIPKIPEIQATPTSTLAGGYINLSCTIEDTDRVNEVYINISQPDRKTTNFSIINNRTGTSYYCNRTYDIIGKYQYYIWVNDTVGNTNTSPIREFFITTYPRIVDIVSTPDSTNQSEFVNISCLIFDPNGINEVYMNIIYPDTTKENISIISNKIDFTYYYNQTYQQIGNYSYYIVAINNRNSIQISPVNRFTILPP